ncbi:MAG: SpoIID/LytB domain-containing protein [Spirochaetia bacterium]
MCFLFLALPFIPVFGGGNAGTSRSDPVHVPPTMYAQAPDIESGAHQVIEEAPEDRLETAVEYWYAGQAASAAGVLRSILEDAADNEDEALREAARDSLIVILREAGKYGEAIEVLEEYARQPQGADEEGSNGDVQVAESIDPRKVALLYLDGRTTQAIEAYERMEADGADSNAAESRTEGDSSSGARTTLFAALAFAADGHADRAVELADEALSAEPYNPRAWRLKGEMYRTQEMYRQAISSFERARSQDPNLTSTLVPQAQAHLALEEQRRARELLVRARAARPHDSRARNLLTEVEEERPEVVEEESRERERRRVTTETPSVSAHPDDLEDIPTIRVGLADSLAEVHLKSGSSWEISVLEGTGRNADTQSEPLLDGEAGSIVHIAYESGAIVVSVDDERELSHELSDGWLQLSTDSAEETTVLFDLEHSSGQFSAGSEDRAYRGSLRFGPSQEEGFAVVNALDVESYLYSVVPSEMPAYWPGDALESQAIAARSYTFASLGRFERRGYDVSGSVRSAFYRGYSGEDARTTEAVNATRGQVLERDGEVVSAHYSANNAGHTDSPRAVWGDGGTSEADGTQREGVADPQLEWDGELRRPDEFVEWLFGYPETYSSIQPYASRSAYRWEQFVEAGEIRERLQGDIGEIQALQILDRTPAGRVRSAEVIGTEDEIVLTGDSVRRRLGSLRSNLFFVSPVYHRDGEDSAESSTQGRIDGFLFHGAGWGHGVGLDQTGAAGFASRGASAEEILEHYYPRASLEQRY